MLFSFLPEAFVIAIVICFGLIIGSFLDVVVSRFHTGTSINGRSHCMSCGHTLSWYELFPLLSYLILRGKCKNCGGFIPLRLFAMECVTALLFLLVYFNAPAVLFLLFSLTLVSVLIVVAAYDMRHMVIPHEFVFIVLSFALLYIGFESYTQATILSVVPHIIAAFAASAFFASLWVISKGKWIGLGDAKLAFPLALMLPLMGAFSFVVLSFWIGAFLSLSLLAIQRVVYSGKHRLPIFTSQLTMKSEVPFAPFMILAFIFVFVANVNVFSILSQIRLF